MHTIQLTYVDQMNRRIILDKPPARIISLVPSQSELLWDLGLRDELVSITKFCIHPEEMFRSKTRVGGTKNLNLEKIQELKPDLIIGNKEENERAQIEELETHYPVWMSDIKNLEDALWMIRELGTICSKGEKADSIALGIQARFTELKAKIKPSGKKVAYLIWKEPLLCASTKSFIGSMLETCGFSNIIQAAGNSYPTLSVNELKQLNPDIIMLSSEPFPFGEKDIPFFKGACPGARVILVDGEMFSWYGSRLLKAPGYFAELERNNTLTNYE